MLAPAEKYLVRRAFGAPAVLLTLAMQGIFRGFKDTTTPLYVICMNISLISLHLLVLVSSTKITKKLRLFILMAVLGYSLNVALDPLLIFVCHLGIRGAAIAHVLSQ